MAEEEKCTEEFKALQKELEEKRKELDELKVNLEKSEELNKNMFQKLEEKIAELTAENKILQEDCRNLQGQLIRFNRMIATGTIGIGIAREFNNMLVGPGVFAQAHLEDKISGEVKSILKELITGCEAGEKLLSILLGGPEMREHSQKVEINEILEDIIILLSDIFEQNKIEVIKSYGTIPEITVKEQKIREVLINIILNAKDSIKSVYESGKITVSTTADREYIKIEISDTGEGISKDCLSDIFDPEITIRGAKSKQIMPGLGRGLANNYGIIAEHRGTMEVESQEGEGCKFKIWLPVNGESESEE